MTLTLSYQNHFKFGYNNECRLRQSPDDVFTIGYGQCTTEPGSFAEASIRAAKLIGETADAPIHVLFSGGADSEVTMRSFLAAKVPITAAIMWFAGDLNLHDVGYAVRFCQKHQVPYQIHEIKILKFFEEVVWDYTTAVRCNTPMMAATMWLVDQIDGYPVLGQGECYLLRPELLRPHRLENAKITSFRDVTFTEDQWALQESESVNGWYRHFLRRGRSGVPGFHQYTPEQILAYLDDPMVVQRLTPENKSSEAWKLAMYQQHFPLADRPIYSGYERIVEQITQCRHDHTAKFLHAHSFVLFDYATLRSYLAAPLAENPAGAAST